MPLDTETHVRTQATTSTVVKSLLALAGMGLISFFAGHLWMSNAAQEREILALQGEIDSLKKDNAKWGTLNEFRDLLVTMDKEIYALNRVFEDRKAWGRVPMEQMQELRKLEEHLEKPVEPRVEAAPNQPIEKLDLDKFRALQQQKYEFPNRAAPKK